MTRTLSILSLLILLLGNPPHAEGAGKTGEIGVTFLPELVSAYSFLATWFPDFLQGPKPPNEQEDYKLLARLQRSLQALNPHGDLPWGIGSAQRTFLVQGGIKGQVYGYPWAKEPDYMTLFITLPASEAAEEIVVISSSVGPQYTTIFSLDTSLRAVLIYDSRFKNTLPPDEPMASIYQVRVRSPQAFELRERLFRPTQGVGGGRLLLVAKGRDGTWRVSTIREGPVSRIR